MADVVFKQAQQHTGAQVTAHVDGSAYPGPELLLSDEVIALMESQFDSLDEDGGGTIEKHEVPPEIWAELDKHFNKDGDQEIDRAEYMQAVKDTILTQALTVGDQAAGTMSQFLGMLCTMANAKGMEYLTAWAAHLQHVHASSPRANQARPQTGVPPLSLSGNSSPKKRKGADGGAAAGPGSPSKVDRIREMKSLKDEGALTEEEFQAEKKKILAGQ
jgi:hypothetical protein